MATAPIVTLGCRLNNEESLAIHAILAAENETPLAEGGSPLAEAGTRLAKAGISLAVVNTCAVTKEAERQSKQAVRRLAKQGHRVVVTGCAATITPDAFHQLDGVVGIVPNGHKNDPARWQAMLRTQRANAAADTNADDVAADANVGESNPKPQTLPSTQTSARVSSIDDQTPVRRNVAIQTGCDHHCTFCIIPQGRGRSLSVPPTTVIEKIRHLHPRPAEIVLTGVDISSYGDDLPASDGESGPADLASLLRLICTAFPDIPRVRLSSLDNGTLDHRFIDVIAEFPQITPYLHLSLQSGDDLILKRMRRRHSASDVESFVRAMRDRRPDVIIGADVIAGFPTETDEQHENTRRHLHDLGVVWGHVFPYSPRAGTPAARMPQIPLAIRRARAATLRADCAGRVATYLQGLVGTTTGVVVESIDASTGMVQGKTGQFATVRASVAPSASNASEASVALEASVASNASNASNANGEPPAMTLPAKGDLVAVTVTAIEGTTALGHLAPVAHAAVVAP
ncbi:MAG: MiaB/RimO family radical SAM methylthiotransferase [Alphaproteobacteria bacterium]|nr:MiaB/RimO family radical SAM methylthiotransferase [Alphaproteobacteria bacterium]